ncbi:type IIL restriction-modification enzyme MmeI [Pseudomonas aeruginosa]
MLGWNTFPHTTAHRTEQGRSDPLRRGHPAGSRSPFSATIADLYDPEAMPDNLRHAHERNDEVLERIYIGRRFQKRYRATGKAV